MLSKEQILKSKLKLWIVLMLVVSMFSGCKPEEFDEKSEEKNDNPSIPGDPKATISKDYWGTWIRMDTGDEYYIDNNAVYKLAGNSKTKVQYGVSNFQLESPETIKSGNIAYFRKGGASRSFTLGLSGFSSSVARAAGIGSQNITGRRKNKDNASDVQSVSVTTSGDEGKLSFTEAVPDDTQSVEVVVDSTTVATVDVTPQYDGENVGTIPIVEKNKYALKTTYTINSKLEDYMYGNNYAEYDITLKIENISTQICNMSFYSITCDDANFKLEGIEKEGNIRTLLAGDYKEFKGKVSYGKLESEYKDVVLKIKIEDGYGDDSWDDSVTLRFYRGRVPLVVNAKVVDGNDSAKLNGFVVYPDGRSKWFSVQSGQSDTVWMPYSENDYVLAFTGATVTSEMKYSFNYRSYAKLADLSGSVSRDEIKAYEPNDLFKDAYNLGSISETVKAALSYGDFDYYKVNNKNQLIGNLASIKVDASGMRKDYYLNQNIDTTGLVVKAVYQGGQEVDVSDLITVGSVNMTSTGTKSVEISYTEDDIVKTETIYITVNDFTATRIQIASMPKKTVYYTEQKFDPTGIRVNATATDGEIIDVTNSVTYSGFDNTTTGTKTVKVELLNNGSRLTTSFSITMRQLVLESIRIDSKPTKTQYYTGQKLNQAGLKVSALYNSGEEKDCTEKVTITFDSANASDSYPVTVKYTENGITKAATFNVIINSLPNNFTTVPIKKTDTYYYFGDWPQSLAENPPVNEADGPAYNDWYIGDDGKYYAKAVPIVNTYQNNFISGKTTWFLVEPLLWKVVSNDSGNLILVSNNVVDCVRWCKGDAGGKHCIEYNTCNYAFEESEVFDFLNGIFKNSAFTNYSLRYLSDNSITLPNRIDFNTLEFSNTRYAEAKYCETGHGYIYSLGSYWWCVEGTLSGNDGRPYHSSNEGSQKPQWQFGVIPKITLKE